MLYPIPSMHPEIILSPNNIILISVPAMASIIIPLLNMDCINGMWMTAYHFHPARMLM